MDLKKIEFLNNAIKGPVTSLLGLAIMGVTLYNVEGGTPWVWEGLTGMGVGIVLVFLKDKLPDILLQIIKGITNKFSK